MSIKYPYASPEVTNQDIEIVVKTLKKGYLTQGEKLIKFQNSLEKYFGSKYDRVLNSGTAALHVLYTA